MAPFQRSGGKSESGPGQRSGESSKRYNLYKNIAKTEAIDPTTERLLSNSRSQRLLIFLPIRRRDDFTGSAGKIWQGDWFSSGGTGPYELDTWNQTDFVKVKNSRVTGSQDCPNWTA